MCIALVDNALNVRLDQRKYLPRGDAAKLKRNGSKRDFLCPFTAKTNLHFEALRCDDPPLLPRATIPVASRPAGEIRPLLHPRP